MKDTKYHTVDSDFIKVVSDDAKNLADEDERAMLRHLEVWDDWGEALSVLRRNIEVQLAERKVVILGIQQRCLEGGSSMVREYATKRTEYVRWHADTVYFKLSVEDRIVELKRLRKKAQPEYGESGVTSLPNLLRWASNLIDTAGEGRDWHTAYDDSKNGNGNTTDGKI